MYKNNSFNNREELNQCIKRNWDNTEKLNSIGKKKKTMTDNETHNVKKRACFWFGNGNNVIDW